MGRGESEATAAVDGQLSAAPRETAFWTDAFVSYSRHDRAFVERLHGALVQGGKEIYVDWEDIPDWSADYESDLFDAIEHADSFLFVLSRDSLESSNCRLELDRAAAQGKRIRPLLRRDVDGTAVPEPLRRPQWLDFRDEDKFETAAARLLEALNVDADWVRGHTRIGVRAGEWSRQDRDSSFLLRGSDLFEAERWLAGQAGKEPAPTPLQVEYVLAARRAASRRQRFVLASIGIALAVAITLAVVALLQRNTAVAQRDRAISLVLAVAARDKLKSDVGMSLLLSLAAEHAAATPQARQIAEQGLEAVRNTGAEAILVHPTTLDGGLAGRVWVKGVAFTPDGRFLATVADDGLRVWSFSPRQTVRRFDSVHRLTAVSVSRDGRTIATGGADGLVRLWNMRTGAQLGRPLGTPGPGESTVAFSPDGKIVAAGGGDGAVRIWDVQTRRLRSEPVPPSDIGDGVNSVRFSPEGTMLAVASNKSGVRLMRLDGSDVSVFVVRDRYGAIPMNAVAFSANGRLLAAGGGLNGYPGVVRVWSVRTRKVLDRFRGHTNEVNAVAFRADGETLVSGGWDDTIRMWSLRTHGPKGAPLHGHTAIVSSLDVSPDGLLLASGSEDGTARVWPLPLQQPAGRSMGGGQRGASGLAFATNTDLVVTCIRGIVRLWSLDGKRMGRLPGSGFTTVAVSPDGRTVAAAVDDGNVRVWDVRSRKPRAELHGHYRTVVFSHDGRTLAAAGEMPSVQLWRVDDLHPIARLPVGANADVWRLAFSQDDRLIAAANQGVVHLWHVREHTPAGVVRPGTQLVRAVAFSPDGRTLATSDDDHGTTLWDVATLKRRGAALDPSGTDAVAFSPDGRLLASTGLGATASHVWLWDVQTEKLFGQPLSNRTGITSALAFTPDGRTLGAAGAGGVWLWTGDLWSTFDELRDLVCALVIGDISRGEWQAAAEGIPYRSQCGVNVG